ncbi:hypothetical protein Golob_001202 [Gossypium lobatum]|uniref:Uncharacterized protein n=1 Tax=Gossypium lobatum TaxID=34289 RepID=A0A7J8NAJ9_9ROSI|nr:hypothetical protein [Gossypium lobatum]
MSGFSQSSASSQNSLGTERKWVPEEDVALVACMVDLYNVETYNADTRFNANYLNELERMLEKVLPHAMLKAKSNLELRIRTLKMDWATVLMEKTIAALVGTSIGRWLCKNDVSLDEMDVSATQLHPSKTNQDGAFPLRTESAQKIYSALCEVEGLIEDKRYCTLSKIPDHPTQMLIFFSLHSSVRLEWVKRFLSDH